MTAELGNSNNNPAISWRYNCIVGTQQ